MVNWPKQRTWGWYATLIRTPWFCVKLLRFRPKAALSMQRHENRTELWLFVCGKGKFENYPQWHQSRPDYYILEGDNKRLWKIPQGWWHKFTAYKKPVYAIEIQYGKVSENDIERK